MHGGNLKLKLFCHRFMNCGLRHFGNDVVQEEIMTWFKGHVTDVYNSGIQKLVPRLNKCLDNAGDYVEK
jgi:hypothetical protein